MYDLDTIGGMNRAVEWTRELFEGLVDGGRWLVPRSGTVVTVYRSRKTVRIVSEIPDPSLERVIKAMGWKVELG